MQFAKWFFCYIKKAEPPLRFRLSVTQNYDLLSASFVIELQAVLFAHPEQPQEHRPFFSRLISFRTTKKSVIAMTAIII